MKHILRFVATAGASSLMLLGTVLVGQASAGPIAPSCGSTVVIGGTLTGPLSCSGPNSGIILAPGVNLDCNGYSIMGDPNVTGEGPGITLTARSTVSNCTVRYFDAGIYIQPGAGGNRITTNTVEDNVGTGDYGDGIVLDTSSGNTISGNTVSRNGPFDGIGLVGKSSNNLIEFNTVTNNNVPNGGRQDDGIRIEGPGAKN
nr:right-handed parallel beta-helix repeat-containing protein [Actinomycetota bacterium]